MKAHGEILREKYPKRKLPRVGYVPYAAVLTLAPALGLRRDFVRCRNKHAQRFGTQRCGTQLQPGLPGRAHWETDTYVRGRQAQDVRASR